MSDTIRASKIIASALLISGGAIALTISAAIRPSDSGPVQLGLMVLIGSGVCLLIPAWRGAPGRGSVVRPEHDVDEIVRGEVERMRSIASAAGRKPSASAGE